MRVLQALKASLTRLAVEMTGPGRVLHLPQLNEFEFEDAGARPSNHRASLSKHHPGARGRAREFEIERRQRERDTESGRQRDGKGKGQRERQQRGSGETKSEREKNESELKRDE